MQEDRVTLYGKFFISGTITTKTGLHIGGSNIGLEIGGTDMIVVRDKITNMPYIPGSSLKGAIRSLLEKADGKKLEYVVEKKGDRKESIMIHYCKEQTEYDNCSLCKIFGISAGGGSEEATKILHEPTRLTVRDAFLDDTTTNLKDNPNTDMPFTEVKTEVVIDRLTSKATPRQVERVPAGAEFKFEMVYNVYSSKDVDYLKEVFKGMELLEGDYLGGQGSRGSGQVRFGKFTRNTETKEVNFDYNNLTEGIKIEWKSADYYLKNAISVTITPNGQKFTPKELKKDFDNLDLVKKTKKEIEEKEKGKKE